MKPINRLFHPTLNLHSSFNKIEVIVVLCLTLLVPTVSFSDEVNNDSPMSLLSLSLEELLKIKVSSASFYEMDMNKTPGFSYVLVQSDIKNSTLRTLGELVEQRIPGMSTGEHPDLGTTIGIRGIQIDANNKIQVMLDGQSINQRMHHGYITGLKAPLLGDLDRIEIILGPSSLRHGSNATSGIINLIPKNGHDYRGLTLNAEYGHIENLTKSEVSYGVDYGENKNVFFYAGAYAASGFTTNDTYGGSDPLDNVYSVEDSSYKLSAYYNSKDFKLNAFYQDYNEIRLFTDTTRNQTIFGISPKYTIRFGDLNSLELSSSIEFIDFGRRDQDSVRKLSSSSIEGGGSEHHYELESIYRTSRFEGHSLAIGGLYGFRKFNEEKQYFHSDYPAKWDAANAQWEEIGLFAEDRIEITDSVSILAGVREDIVIYKGEKETLHHTSPRLSVVVQINPTTIARFAYQHGYRTPDALFDSRKDDDMVALNSANPGKNYDLTIKPETIEGAEFNFQKVFPEYNLIIDFNAFYTYIRDPLSFVLMAANYEFIETGYFTAEAIDAVRASLPDSNGNPQLWWGTFGNFNEDLRHAGGELIFRYRANTTKFEFSYSYASPIEMSDAHREYRSHQYKGDISRFLLNKKLLLSTSFKIATAPESSTDSLHPSYSGTRKMIDVLARYTVNRNYSMSFTVKNLLKEDVPRLGWSQDDLSKSYIGEDHRFYYFELQYKL